MKVKNLIKAMKYLNQDEEIIVMWWERDTVKRWVGREVTDNEWANAEEELMTHDWVEVDRIITDTITLGESSMFY
jgi:hypothetical protein